MATFAPTLAKDLYIRLGTPTFNYGGATTLNIGTLLASADIYRTLLDFGSLAAIPAGSTINSAILTLECVAFFGVAVAFSVFRVTSPTWVEGAGTAGVPTINPDPGASWNNKDNTAPTVWTLAGGDFTATGGSTGFLTPASTGTKTYDIKTVIQACLDLGVDANLLCKADNETGSAGFDLGQYSGREGATAPTLLITYTPPAGTLVGGSAGSMGLLGIGG